VPHFYPPFLGTPAQQTHNGCTMSTGIWFNDVTGVLDKGAEANFVVLN
jgi:hypothetical protein